MTTQVQALAKYAARGGFADLSQESRRQLPIHILDSLGCCIAALGAGPVQACREQVAEFERAPGTWEIEWLILLRFSAPLEEEESDRPC
jgi:2-methylcitrate dehydratase PrpD